MSEPLVSARNLTKRFTSSRGGVKRTVNAVSDVSFDIVPGETLALVGESGCGKTTLGRMLALLLAPTSGELRIHGQNVVGLARKAIKPLRRHVQMVFQDPVSSLNPRHTVEAMLTEPMQNFGLYSSDERRFKAAELLEAVGLAPQDLRKYPHEFSGGQRQRITVARALVLQPEFVVADEPVSALDVSVQSQILNLLVDLRERFGLTYLFISHDLAVVHHLADRIAVMYLGEIVEVAPKETLFANPVHPYTRALLSSVPTITQTKGRIGRILQGDPPSPMNPPSGCHFHPRCPHAEEQCREEPPRLARHKGDAGHSVACHLQDTLA
ncbi:MAG: dipeptide ABC transporter ATP-binding protein [Gammaproteobacteria bacterium]|jgi:oligopeptide transport system ATP-binding protein